MNAHRGEDSTRHLILRDLPSFLDPGALDRATGLLVDLALFLRDVASQDLPIFRTSLALLASTF